MADAIIALLAVFVPVAEMLLLVLLNSCRNADFVAIVMMNFGCVRFV